MDLKIVEAVCSRCGGVCDRFRNASGEWVYGCPQCDKGQEASPSNCGDDNTTTEEEPSAYIDHLCTLDELLINLRALREQIGGKAEVMISLDKNQHQAMVPYLPCNSVASDLDEPGRPLVLFCVANGNHPFSTISKFREPNFAWHTE